MALHCVLCVKWTSYYRYTKYQLFLRYLQPMKRTNRVESLKEQNPSVYTVREDFLMEAKREISSFDKHKHTYAHIHAETHEKSPSCTPLCFYQACFLVLLGHLSAIRIIYNGIRVFVKGGVDGISPRDSDDNATTSTISYFHHRYGVPLGRYGNFPGDGSVVTVTNRPWSPRPPMSDAKKNEP